MYFVIRIPVNLTETVFISTEVKAKQECSFDMRLKEFLCQNHAIV